MSSGGLSVRALSSADVPSVSLQWLEMLAPSAPPVDPAKPKAKAPPPKQSNYAVRVNATTNAIVGNIKDPLNLISVIGPARSGKSTLMNFLSGSTTELFPTSPGAVTFTKGVYIPSKFLSLPVFSSLEGEPVIDATDSNVNISFVDTEGQGAVGQLYDMNLFSPALLCSQVVLYNRTGGLLTEEILNQLAMMTQAGQRLIRGQSITADDTSTSAETNGANDATNSAPNGTSQKPPFGHLVILFNRFQLSTVDDVATMTTSLLDPEEVLDTASDNRNQIRELLKTCFQSVTVRILPDGYLKREAQDAMRKDKSRFLTLADFESEYLDYFKQLRTDLSKMLQTPRQLVPGTSLTGGAIANFVPSLADAINAQEPLNVPNIFQASQNDAINKALIKFKNDLGKSLSEIAGRDARPSAALGREIDTDINLVLADMRTTLSYMPSETLSKAQDDATAQAKPMKEASLAVNLGKVQTRMKVRLNEIVADLRTTVSTAFVDDKVLVAKADLDATFESLQSDQVNTYKIEGQSYDDLALPTDYAQVLQQAFEREKKVLDQRYTDSWQTWVAQQSQVQLNALRDQLNQLATTLQPGEKKPFSAGLLIATEKAKGDFNAAIASKYRASDAKAQQDTFAAAVDDTAKLIKANWEQNESEVLEQLEKKRKTCETDYTRRLNDAIAPGRQPAPYDSLTASGLERGRLEAFITDQKIGTTMKNDTLDTFDTFVDHFKGDYSAKWSSATAIFESRLQDQIKENYDEVTNSFQDSLDPIPYTYAAAIFLQMVNSCATNAQGLFDTFKTRAGTLSEGSVALGRMNSAKRAIDKMVKDISQSKLRSFDDLASMWNRALLNKIVRPIVDKTLSDAETYTSRAALDTALEEGHNNFLAQKRALTSDDERAGVVDAEKQWALFRKRAYDGLVENVNRNGAAYGYKANDKVPLDLQTKIINSTKDDLANLAGWLGFSYINSDRFDGVEIQDKGMTDGATPYDLDKSATRSLLLQNSRGDNFWPDKPTSMMFHDWVLESSDYIMGKPVITEMKPIVTLSQTMPAEAKDRPFTSTANVQVSSAITNSQAGNITFGGKVGYKVGDPKLGGETTLEASFGAGVTFTDQKAITNTFSVSGSSSVTLPAGRVCTVTQVGFDQKTTIPYTCRMKFIPKVRYQGGFIRMGGHYLKRSYFDSNKQTDRVLQDFEMGRTDQIRDVSSRNEGPFDWPRFNRDGHDYYAKSLANPETYTFYIKGKWEGLSGKAVLLNVVPSQAQFELLPDETI